MKKNSHKKVEAFTQRLRALMKENNVTQRKIAEICSVKAQSVSQWYNGDTQPDIASLVKIAKFFNVTTDYLLGLTDIGGAESQVHISLLQQTLADEMRGNLAARKEIDSLRRELNEARGKYSELLEKHISFMEKITNNEKEN